MSIPGSATPLLLATTAAAGPAAAFQIDRSLRFDRAAQSYLKRTPASAGNRRTFTFSCWHKKSGVNSSNRYILFNSYASGSVYFSLEFETEKLKVFDGGAISGGLATDGLFRDSSAWYHIVCAIDTTDATAANRVKLYVNGVQQTLTGTQPSQNSDLGINTTTSMLVGAIDASGIYHNLDGYLAETHFIDGQALAPTDFGETDSNNNWNPKEYAGTYGTNGFRLNFSDNSSDDALGYDSSVTAPTVNPDAGFDVVTYTGNGGTQAISGLSFEPDFVWFKSRSAAYGHRIFDSVRGFVGIYPNETVAEDANAVNENLVSYDPNGFTVGTTSGINALNNSNVTMVAWCWKAGGASETNTDGSITSQVSVSNEYGFSIVKYTGQTNAQTVGHGLSSAPKFIITKNLDRSCDWIVYHESLDSSNPEDKFLRLNQTNTPTTSANYWGSGGVTSSVFGVDNGVFVNINGEEGIAYCWSEVSGFSKFGSYTGNGSSTGPTITTGFKPRWIIIKRTDSADSWQILDTERGGSSSNDDCLFADLSNAEAATSSRAVDFLDDGFQPRGTNDGINASGGTYVYAAFADRPGNNFDVNNLVATAGADGAAGFEAVTYTGNGGTQSISGLQFQPDLLWIKSRSKSGYNHKLVDSVRGNTKTLRSNTTGVEFTNTNQVTSFNSDGFSLGADNSAPGGFECNELNNNFVAWAWNAGANSNKTYTVKVVSDSGNKYRFDDFGTSAVTLDLQEGSTYVFDQSDSSNAGHPIRFGTSANGTDYTTGVTHTGTPGSAGAKTTLVLGTGVATLYYSCANHSGMGGQINTNSTAGASNLDGTIQAVVKASTTYGFSVCTYTGTSNAGTVGHSLGAVPRLIFFKSRNGAFNWNVYHNDGSTKRIFEGLNTTNAGGTTINAFSADPSTTVLSLAGGGYSINSSGKTMVAYMWSEIPGYSRFGSYTGNGSTTGPVVTTGFKPRFVLIKRADSAASWQIKDTARTGSVPPTIYANLSNAESTDSSLAFDFLDNGFQPKTSTDGGTNANGGTYIYAAFADKPDGSVIDSLIDTPTNYDAASGNNGGNYCTMNPLDNGGLTLANGNLDASTSSAGSWRNCRHTIGMSSGKWYWEVECKSSTSGQGLMIGILDAAGSITDTIGNNSGGYAYNAAAGNKYNNGSGSSYGAGFNNGDIIGVAFNADAGSLTFYKNGISQGVAFSSITSKTYFPAVAMTGTMVASVNHGARAFAYTPPTGHLSLCTQNLPDPTIADGSTAFDAKLWTGTGSSRSITGYGFSPDLAWIKSRSDAYVHYLVDTVRGAQKRLSSNNTNAEATNSQSLTAFNSDGFDLGNEQAVNENSDTFVGWAWDAGTSTVSNTDGSITSSVRANASAGFSIGTYTGTYTAQPSSLATVGHGLNAAPGLVITKSRGGSNWHVWHSALDNDEYLRLNSTNAKATLSAGAGGSIATAPTSSVFPTYFLGGSNNGPSDSLVFYCFAPVAGYSAFGSYTGNGSADGPFVFTGFRPKWLLIKKYDAGANNWYILDTERDTYNTAVNDLYADIANAENSFTGATFDILSNGFKVRTTEGSLNSNGASVLYAAFAEHPLKTARAR